MPALRVGNVTIIGPVQAKGLCPRLRSSDKDINKKKPHASAAQKLAELKTIDALKASGSTTSGAGARSL